jgi:hypothetical protein
MSISDTVSQTAATNPTVGVAVSSASIKSDIIAGMQTGDTTTANLLGAMSTQSLQVNKLLSSLGQNVDLSA